MCEIEVSSAAFEDEGGKLFVLQVLLEYHVSYQLGDIVLEVVAFLTAVDYRVDPLLGEQGVGVLGYTAALIQVIQQFVDGLPVVMLYVAKPLGKGNGTIAEPISRPSMGMRSKMFLRSTCSSSSLMSSCVGKELLGSNRRCACGTWG